MARSITTGTVTTSMEGSSRPVISWGAIFGGFVAAGLGGAIGGALAREPGVAAESSARTDADDGYPVGRAS